MRMEAHVLARYLASFLKTRVLFAEERRKAIAPLRKKLPLHVREDELDALVTELFLEFHVPSDFEKILVSVRSELLLALVFRMQGAISILRSQGDKTYLVRDHSKIFGKKHTSRLIEMNYILGRLGMILLAYK